jgi:intracellular sulfur oxidation DsrE/DsrF family protein
MEKTRLDDTTNRRKFLGALGSGAAAMSIASIAPLQHLNASPVNTGNDDDPDEWFKKIKGKHRIVFDATHPHEIMPFVWPKVFLMTNEATGTPSKDNSVVVVLRHSAIGYAFEDSLWAKYKLGELFKAHDPATANPATGDEGKLSVRNPFWKPAKGAFAVPGFGEVQIGINELQENGVMFCVCNAAMTVYSAILANMMSSKPEDVMKDFKAGLLPGIQVVPSGVWALGRAQEHGCGYIFAG